MDEKLAEQIKLFKDSNIGIVISNTLYFNNKGKVKKLYKNKNLQREMYLKHYYQIISYPWKVS